MPKEQPDNTAASPLAGIVWKRIEEAGFGYADPSFDHTAAVAAVLVERAIDRNTEQLRRVAHVLESVVRGGAIDANNNF